MVVPEHICDATRQGKSRVVMAWLDAAQGSVNDKGMAHAWSSLDAGYPLLSWTCFPHLGFRSLSRRAEITQSHVELARLLLARGADPNWRDRHGDGPLHCACYKTNNNATVEMVSLLIEAGTEFENRRNITNEDTGIVGDYGTETPLSLAMKATLEPQGHAGDLFVSPPAGLRIICMLLRAGASLDTLGSWPARESAEYHLLSALNKSSGHFYYSRRLKDDDLQRWQCHFDALWGPRGRDLRRWKLEKIRHGAKAGVPRDPRPRRTRAFGDVGPGPRLPCPRRQRCSLERAVVLGRARGLPIVPAASASACAQLLPTCRWILHRALV